MKMKSFAILATSGLLAAALGCAAPALAEDMNDQAAQPSTMTDNSNNANETQNNMNLTDNAAAPANIGANADEGTPDTATGDDDY